MVSRLGWFRASKADGSSTQLLRRCYWYMTAHWRWGWRLSLCGHRLGGLWKCFISFSDIYLSLMRFFSVWLVSTWNTSLSLYDISPSSLLDQLAINISPDDCHIVEMIRGCMHSLWSVVIWLIVSKGWWFLVLFCLKVRTHFILSDVPNGGCS